MKNDKRFFEIGVLSKLTGVHVRCLRYYEKLGILKPAYVNKETSYRFYTYRHIRVIEAIQYCVELDIPLKKFVEFYSIQNNTIDYASLIAYGKKVAEEKLKKILKKQKFLEETSAEMLHAKECEKTKRLVCVLPEKRYYCKPYSMENDILHFQTETLNMIKEMQEKGFNAGYDNGIFLRIENGEEKYYLYVNVKDRDFSCDEYSEIVTIPKGKYLCITQDKSMIANAKELFKEQLKNHKSTVILENELFSENFHYENPTYELRFYLGE